LLAGGVCFLSLLFICLSVVLIDLFPLSAAEQNEVNPENEEKLSER
jgi:hypothetical protein